MGSLSWKARKIILENWIPAVKTDQWEALQAKKWEWIF
jgi:hypothetical protein